MTALAAVLLAKHCLSAAPVDPPASQVWKTSFLGLTASFSSGVRHQVLKLTARYLVPIFSWYRSTFHTSSPSFPTKEFTLHIATTAVCAARSEHV